MNQPLNSPSLPGPTSSFEWMQFTANSIIRKKGFWDDEPQDETAMRHYDGLKIALMHSELSEALEALRSGDTGLYYVEGGERFEEQRYEFGIPVRKPEGLDSELADVVLRVMDYAQQRGINLADVIRTKMEYNSSRATMHGRKF